MSIIADLYIRVSTDEQAEKGYSKRNQEEVLRRYCSINFIDVRNVVYEDHSAKTFNRPQWNKLLLSLKKQKNKSDLVLFTKWDRFSRNAGDAYQMISVLRKLGVESQAIEHPLDLSDKRSQIGLIFPENFTIRENKIQTARVNKIVESIYVINNELEQKKRDKR